MKIERLQIYPDNLREIKRGGDFKELIEVEDSNKKKYILYEVFDYVQNKRKTFCFAVENFDKRGALTQFIEEYFNVMHKY